MSVSVLTTTPTRALCSATKSRKPRRSRPPTVDVCLISTAMRPKVPSTTRSTSAPAPVR
jgi:hypothetical protein